uniref:non-specific serine/threonine protein kinase n=1 Tax=Ananas comosus var. bracteatus TaxID=296719 RepID=A0A6V7QEC9_ANACO|nr:unnamed protein product [Ananas comosus var. bracteatus]
MKYNLEVPVWSVYIDSTVVTTDDLQLSISDDGNLILLSKDGSLIWSTNVTSPAASNSTVAVLLDSGNLVLRDGLNSSNVLWQSFDHPSDTWLPGAPLGFDRSTGNHIFLTSFYVDPSYYSSLDVETVGSPQFVLQTNGSGGDCINGCRRVTPLSCKNESSSYRGYIFENLPDNPQSFPASDHEECESACTSNCSCTAYSFSFGCKLWHGDLIDSALCDHCSMARQLAYEQK